MRKTLAEKILSEKAGKEVKPGDVVWAKPDLLTRYDGAIPDVEIGVDPDRIALAIDHQFMPTSEETAKIHQHFREISKKYGIKHFYDVGRGGVLFQILAEEGVIRPGMLVADLDPHVSTYGAYGAYCIGVGNDIVEALRTGQVWVRVPETLKVNVTGRFKPGVTSRDLFEKMMADLGPGGALGQVIQYTGPGITSMGLESRMVLCNMAQFLSAETAIIEADKKVTDYLSSRAGEPVEAVRGDRDGTFARTIKYDLGEVEPQIVVPPEVDDVKPVRELAGIAIDQACLGTCASGRMEDLRLAAKIMKGKKVHPGVRFAIVPLTWRISQQAAHEGLLDVFWEAGAVVGPPGCGTCTSKRGYGFLLPGEVCITTGQMNIPGRMGSPDAEIYLASCATVTASAITGKITDPREFLKE